MVCSTEQVKGEVYFDARTLASPVLKPSYTDSLGSLMYPLGYVEIAMESGQSKWIYPIKIVISHSYGSLPEGI